MSKDEILHSSKKFLLAIYQNYVKRACENLGVSSESDENDNNTIGKTQLTEADYPTEFISYTQAQREKYVAESGMSDKEFLSQFSEYVPH